MLLGSILAERSDFLGNITNSARAKTLLKSYFEVPLSGAKRLFEVTTRFEVCYSDTGSQFSRSVRNKKRWFGFTKTPSPTATDFTRIWALVRK